MPGMAFTPDFGSVPDWVEAIGTSGALGFLAYQVIRERRRDRQMQEREAAARRDDEARQARLVSVAIKFHYGLLDDDYGWRIIATVINDSAEPIRNVEPYLMPRAIASLPLATRRGATREMLKDAIRTWWPDDDQHTVISPGKELGVTFVPIEQPDEPGDPHDPATPDTTSPFVEKYDIGAVFTDAAGARWSLTHLGEPERWL